MRLSSGNQQKRRGERGSVLAISAFGMLAFLLATGLCIDISHFYLVKTELQNAADAASLAGAAALNADDGGIKKAVDQAVEQLNKYEFNKSNVTITRASVTFSRNLNGTYVDEAAAKIDARNIRFIKVSIPPVAVNTTFAAPVLGTSRNLTADATAGMSVPLNVFCDWIPLSAIDADTVFFTPGNTYTIRSAPGNKVSPGNYQILAVDGAGAKDDRIDLAGGVRNCVGAGSFVDTKPGVSAGPVRQGLNTRFNSYGAGLSKTDYPPDENVKEDITYQQYLDAQQQLDAGQTPGSTTFQAPSGGGGVRNRRVVLIPIIKESQFGNGRSSVQIDRFAAFFLQTSVAGGNGGDIQAEYIGIRTVLGRGGYDAGGGTPSPELTIPVLYK
jgi:Flp pilus assembly protein TadG